MGTTEEILIEANAAGLRVDDLSAQLIRSFVTQAINPQERIPPNRGPRWRWPSYTASLKKIT